MKHIVLIINLFMIMSCSSKTEEVKHNLSFVSESFQNRFIDDGTTQTHDLDDLGFYTNHFDPMELHNQTLENRNTQKLKKVTGIEWQEIFPFDSILNFKNFITPNTNRIVYLAV